MEKKGRKKINYKIHEFDTKIELIIIFMFI